MSKVKILVVEDEILIADNMCDALNELGYETFEPAMNYTEAITTINEELPDIAILDIHLSGRRSGIDIAKKIKEEYDFPFIFLTSYSDTETVEEAKKYEPAAFLVKPFSKEELFTSIEIAISNFSSYTSPSSKEKNIIKESLFVKEKGVFIKLNLNDILFIKSEHVYLELTLKDSRKHLIRGSLNNVIAKLNNNFLRVHRSYIVNANYLDQIDTAFVKIDHNSIPIGKKYRHSLLERLNII